MKTQIINILSGIILVLSMASVQATETVEIIPSITDANAQIEVLPQEISDIFSTEVEIDGISLVAEQEMAESFGSRYCKRGRCCRHRR